MVADKSLVATLVTALKGQVQQSTDGWRSSNKCCLSKEEPEEKESCR
jgi:hypothetical protein